MNAVVSPSPMQANSATSNRKIRRKTDTKPNLPQSQINKCNNEKRRRELENNYIEQLSEFLQLSKRGDISSTKPDKAAILNQVVKTYRDIYDKGQSRLISSTAISAVAHNSSLIVNCNNDTNSTTTSTSNKTGTTTTTNNNNNNNSNNNNLLNNNNNNDKRTNLTTTTQAAATASVSNNTTTATTTTTNRRCTRCATDNCSIHHPVQQGDVSSSEPPLPEPSLLNGQVPEISAYFEALEHYITSVGWVLLQVNCDGIIESCTQNIRELIGFEKHELQRKPLNLYLYPGDQAKLDPIIYNISFGNNTNATKTTGGNQQQQQQQQHKQMWDIKDDSQSSDLSIASFNNTNNNASGVGVGGVTKSKRSISTKIRLLSKDIRTQQRQRSNDDKYEEVVLIAAPIKDDGDSASSVLCLITRPEDESPLEMNIQQHVLQAPVEQVTFKLDIHGKILNLDGSALRDQYRQYLTSWEGRLLQDFCHTQDLHQLKGHLRDLEESVLGLNVISGAQSPGGTSSLNPPISNIISRPFRLRFGLPDVYVHVKANSRFFLNQMPGENDFIMSVHTLLHSEQDLLHNNNNNNNNTALMSSNANGDMSLDMAHAFGNNLINSAAAAGLSPNSSLVSSLVSTLTMDPMASNHSVESGSNSNLSQLQFMGGLIGGGDMPNQQTTHTNSLGGPLMTSAIINGANNTVNARNNNNSNSNNNNNNNSTGMLTNNSTSSLINSYTASPAAPETSSFFSNDPFDFELPPHSSFDIDHTVSNWPDSRPNSRASVITPVSTPRPPSAGHGFSPAICASPSTSFQMSSHSAASLPSPQSNASQPTASSGAGFSLSSFNSSFDMVEKSEKDEHPHQHLHHHNIATSDSSNILSNLNVAATSVMSNMPPNLVNQQQSTNTATTNNAPPATDSERLRHLLTNKAASSAHSSLHSDDDNKDHSTLLKGLPNDDKDSSEAPTISGFKMSGGGGTAASRLFAQNMQKSSNTNNPMLLSLLNENDDTKTPTTVRPSELMRQLQMDPNPQHKNNNLSNEDLKRMLKIQSDASVAVRKRSQPDDGLSNKRTEPKVSKLALDNRMLAALLETPTKNPKLSTPPQIKTIPDINPSTITSNRVSSSINSGNSEAAAAAITVKSNSSANVITTTQSNQQPLQQHSNMASSATASAAVAAAMATLQRSQMQQAFNNNNNNNNNNNPFVSTSGSVAGAATATMATQQQQQQQQHHHHHHHNPLSGLGDGDPELSKLLDSFMDYFPSDEQQQQQQTPFATTESILSGLTQQEKDERMAINAIQKSLILETSGFSAGAQQQMPPQQQQQQRTQTPLPPAYPVNMLGNVLQQQQQHQQLNQQQQQQQQQQMLQLIRQQNPQNRVQQQNAMQQILRGNAPVNQVFQRPPPTYTARARAPLMNNTVSGGMSGNAPTPQQFRQHQIAQQQKERLLQQQQKQQMLVPENATARGDQLGGLNPVNNIGNLLNTAVAPNVSLSRTNIVDSPLSPNYAQTLLQQQQQQQQQQQPQLSPSTGYSSQFANTAQRLSPQQQQQQQQQNVNVAQQQQQQLAAFQAVATSNNTAAQLSPRQPPPFGNNLNNNIGAGSPVMGAGNNAQQWAAAAGAAVSSTVSQRGLLLQQHNPMLSAQLQGVSPYNARGLTGQRRNMNSPGSNTTPNATVVTLQRQNSFKNMEQPSAAVAGFNSSSPQSPYNTNNVNVNMFQHQQHMQRMRGHANMPQTAPSHMMGNTNSSDFVKQELRAVVSGRAQQQNAGMQQNTVSGGNNTVVGNNSSGGGGGGLLNSQVETMGFSFDSRK